LEGCWEEIEEPTDCVLDGMTRLFKNVAHLVEASKLFHALGEFRRSFFQLLAIVYAFGEIAGDAGQGGDLAVVIADWKNAGLEPAHRAIGPEEPVFDDLALPGNFRGDVFDNRLVIRVNGFEVAAGAFQKGFHGVTGERFVGRTDIGITSQVRLGNPKNVRNILGENIQPKAAPLLRLFRFLEAKEDDIVLSHDGIHLTAPDRRDEGLGLLKAGPQVVM